MSTRESFNPVAYLEYRKHGLEFLKKNPYLLLMHILKTFLYGHIVILKTKSWISVS